MATRKRPPGDKLGQRTLEQTLGRGAHGGSGPDDGGSGALLAVVDPSDPAALESAVGSADPLTKADMQRWIQEVKSDIAAVAVQVRETVQELRSDLFEVGSRVDVVETRLDTCEASVTGVQQKLEDAGADYLLLLDKVEDLENRTRRNNLRVWELPELPEYRDNFVIKERALRRAQELGTVTWEGHRLEFYQDLAASTLQKRRSFRGNLRYRWTYPFGVVITINGVHTRVVTVREARDLLLKAGIEVPEVSGPELRELEPAGGPGYPPPKSGTSRGAAGNLPVPLTASQSQGDSRGISLRKSEPLGVSLNRKAALGVSLRRKEPLGISLSRPRPLAVSRNRSQSLGISLSRKEPLGIQSRTQQSCVTRAEPLGVSRPQPPCVPRSESLNILRSRKDPLSVSRVRAEPLGVSRTRAEPLSLARTRAEPLSVPRCRKEPLGLSRVRSWERACAAPSCLPLKPVPSRSESHESTISLRRKDPLAVSLNRKATIGVSLSRKEPLAVSLGRKQSLNISLSREKPLNIPLNRKESLGISLIRKEPLCIALNRKEPLRITRKEPLDVIRRRGERLGVIRSQVESLGLIRNRVDPLDIPLSWTKSLCAPLSRVDTLSDSQSRTEQESISLHLTDSLGRQRAGSVCLCQHRRPFLVPNSGNWRKADTGRKLTRK
uniref:Uncharacterized protein LOC117368877 n=1 Tax=Geotrypetes seraphini TaxID=260995 RepID=A0A6P8SQM9_GEOSA|nr:uncharacterized protein LOC117368877 [Geotrypetes seraphini]